MATASVKGIVNAPAEEVWQTIRPFVGIERYCAAFAGSTIEGSGVGARRVLITQDGGRVHETLEALDDGARMLRYRIDDPGPFPVANYTSTMAVRDLGNAQAEFEWSSTFQTKDAPDEAVVEAVEQLYSLALEGLRALHGQPSASPMTSGA